MMTRNGHQDPLISYPATFLLSFVKSQLYSNKPRAISELKTEITRMIGGIGRDVCKRVVKNFEKRINACQLSEGGHMTNIVFHTLYIIFFIH